MDTQVETESTTALLLYSNTNTATYMFYAESWTARQFQFAACSQYPLVTTVTDVASQKRQMDFKTWNSTPCVTGQNLCEQKGYIVVS